jgi:O-antigen/teichoic acid export membrane protein
MVSLIHRSVLFSAIERYGGVFVFMASTAVLSRLLTPREFGIYAVVSAITTVTAASFQEFGGANYLIQKPSLSERDIQTAFTITLGLSVLFAAVLFELRGVAAGFFSEEGLQSAIAAATVNFLLLPFLTTISTLLRRDLEFGALARCNLAGAIVNAIVSIALAVLDYSYLAPIFGTAVGNAAVLALLVSSRCDLTIFRPSISGYSDVIGFGAYSGGTAIINVFYNLAPQLILARMLDFNAVGLYSRAINVTQVFDKLVTQVLSPVIMPAIFARIRTGGDVKRIYLNALELIAVVQWPFLIVFALLAEPIIRIWFGPTWLEIVPLIRMLCTASLFLFGACLTYPVLVAVGRVRDTLISSLISLPPSLLVIFVASFFGVWAVAASALLTFPFQAVVALYFIGRQLAISSADIVRAMLRSGIATACSIVGVLASMAITEFSLTGPIFELILAGIFAAAGWWLGLIVTGHPLLAHIRLAVSDIAVGAAWLAPGGCKAVRPNEKSS